MVDGYDYLTDDYSRNVSENFDNVVFRGANSLSFEFVAPKEKIKELRKSVEDVQDLEGMSLEGDNAILVFLYIRFKSDGAEIRNISAERHLFYNKY